MKKETQRMEKHNAKFYLVPAGVCLLALIALVFYYTCTVFSDHEETLYVYVDSDDTADSVFSKLQPIASQHALAGLSTMLRHGDYDNKVRTGRYAIDPGMRIFQVYRRLKNGQQTPMMLTVPESRTMDRLAAALSRKLMVDSTAIAQVLCDSIYCSRLGYNISTIAAMFVPNTYEVYWDLSVDQLLARMKKEHDVFWNKGRLAKAQALGLTPDEVCTLASIIDEETANNDEKPMIAGMYLNRLKEGMPLQADPTVKFALADFSIRRIYRNMLTTDSPYNTYKNEGLPPGPIKIASVKGIDAVLNRVQHDYLYMCAKEDFSGTHNFARTYNEHLANAARYARALNERGVK